MPKPMIAPLPPGLDLTDGYVVRFTALDPSTGAVVSGVNITGATLQVKNLGGSAAPSLQAGPFLLVPGPAS